MENLSCFKAYDIRGKVPSELNSDLAYKIGKAYAKFLNARKIVIGHDVRKSSEDLSAALSKGLMENGSDVLDIGLCGTEMIYYSTPALNADGGIMITASHNPKEYNGMKFVKRDSVPVGYESGLNEIERMILKNEIELNVEKEGSISKKNVMNDFINNLSKFYDKEKFKPLRVVVNAGNGCVGPALEKIEPLLPVKMVKVFFEPDSDFPNGIPNPLLPENRQTTIDAIRKNKADLGVAWDGDYDRCFFFDEKGNFIEGYYIVGLLAKSILKKNPGERIVHDPRLIWNTVEVVNKYGGKAVVSKSGHAYIKEKMRGVNAIYGGEMSAHHYFRENSYSDSGMIPFLLILQLISEENKPLSRLVDEMIKAYPCSGEINSKIDNPEEKLKEIENIYAGGRIDHLDGVSIEFHDWRFNLRMSNTEPIVRLNVECKANERLMHEKTKELLDLIRS